MGTVSQFYLVLIFFPLTIVFISSKVAGKLPSNPLREKNAQNQMDLRCHKRWTFDEDTKIITAEMPDHPIAYKGLGYFLYENILKHIDNVAQINAETGESHTYREILLLASRTAIELKKRGIKPGDIVSSYSYNQKYSVVVFIATAFIGAIINNLDVVHTLNDLKHLVDLVQPKILFVCDDCEENINVVIKDLGLDTEIVAYSDKSTNGNKFSQFILPKENEDTFEPYTCDDWSKTTIILFSSGTTGLPKGICLHHQQIIFNCSVYNTPSILNRNSLYWVASAVNVAGCAYSGTARLYMTKFDPELIWHQIEKYNVPYMYLPPYFALEMIKYKPAGHITNLAYFSIVGHGTSDENIKKIKAAMPKTIIMCPYGLTEAGPIFSVAALDDDNLQGTGTPGLGYTYKVVDLETGQNVGFGKIGELRVKHKYHMNSYYRAETTDCFDEEGFLKTGDAVWYDENFTFYIVDRYKEMFKYRGIHIIPAKLENILSEHPEVTASVVVGIPNSVDDNHPMVVVSVKDQNKVTAEEIEDFINKRVTDNEKIRAGVKFVKKFPVTASGKLARYTLKKMVLNGEI